VEVVAASDFDRRAADLVIETLRRALADRSGALMALSGGSTPRSLYAELASRRRDLDWTRVRFVWGDERCVPHDDPDSNVRMARESLLEPLGIDEANIFAPRTRLEPREAANAYEIVLRGLDEEQAPRLDLALLGMGADGHTASLFPGGDELELPESRLVAATRAPAPPHDRISLTLSMLDRSRSVLFVVTGKSKAEALRKVVEGDHELPAARVRPAEGELRWLVHEALARAAGVAPS
jgi:6-phosphogluconolactonase